jgi:hypothetical protein
MNIRKIHSEPSSHKGFWQYLAFASVAIPTALVSYCLVADKNPNDELQKVSAVVSNINENLSSAGNTFLENYKALDRKFSERINSAANSALDRISFSSLDKTVENTFGYSAAEIKRFFLQPEAVILRHWKKDFYGFDFEKAVDAQVEEYKQNIRGVSRCFSNLTPFDNYIADGVKNSKYITDGFARSYLAQEGCGDLYAKSWKNAIGPAQFMKTTAINIGIEINRFVDYRRHPTAITKGILHLDALADEYNGDTMLALMGYNASKGKFCDPIIHNYGPDYLWSEVNNSIPAETEDYVIRVSALKRIYENPEEYGLKIKKKQLFSDQIRKEHEVRKNESIFKIAKAYGIPLKRIARVNPQINGKIKEGMVVNIPY